MTKILFANRQHLTRALDDALRRLAESPEGMRAHAIHTSSEPVVEVLSSEPVFREHPSRMINQGNQASGFSADVIGPKLLRLAEEQGPEAAVDWLGHVLAATEAEALCIVAIGGVRVREASSLAENIFILPFDQLPASYNKQTLGQPSFDHRLVNTQLGQAPTSTLLSRIQVRPFFIEGDDLLSGSSVAKQHERLASVTRVLAVVAVANQIRT